MVVFTCCRNSGGGVSLMLVFFFKQRTAYEMRISDWSSDVCSSDRVADRVDFRLVEPGPLPFAAGRFDAVFSKDALIHIPDKQGLYAEVLRVLRPGGAFAASDWLAGEGALDDPAFRRYVDLGHLKFTMATAEENAAIMRESGFA